MSRLLLDTQVVVWWDEASSLLGRAAERNSRGWRSLCQRSAAAVGRPPRVLTSRR
jgi:hypothetical protein